MKPEALLSVSRVLHLLLHTFPVDAIPTFPLSDIPDPVRGAAPPCLSPIAVSDLVTRLRETFPAHQMTESRMEKIIAAVDPDHDGLLNYADWYVPQCMGSPSVASQDVRGVPQTYTAGLILCRGVGTKRASRYGATRR